MLRAVYVNQKDVKAYATLCQATELTEHDCHALAKMLVARRKPEDALSWVERGLTLGRQGPGSSTGGENLARLSVSSLLSLGVGMRQRQGAWAEFCKHPSKCSYDDLMKHVPEPSTRLGTRRPSMGRWEQTCVRSCSCFLKRRSWGGSQNSSAGARIAPSKA